MKYQPTFAPVARGDDRDYQEPKRRGERTQHAERPLEQPNLVSRRAPESEDGDYREDGRGEKQKPEGSGSTARGTVEALSRNAHRPRVD
jgi:hypothetical protein